MNRYWRAISNRAAQSALIAALVLAPLLGAACGKSDSERNQATIDSLQDNLDEIKGDAPVDAEYVEFCSAYSAGAMIVLGGFQNAGPAPYDALLSDVNRVNAASVGAPAMAEAAPDEIKTEMETLATTLSAVIDDPSQTPPALDEVPAPFDTAYDAVDTFVEENCEGREL
jgi:hypothetical protein